MIVDGADNFPTRYLLNDASVWHGVPVVHGSIFRFEGQATVFAPKTLQQTVTRRLRPGPVIAVSFRSRRRARAELCGGRSARVLPG